MTTLRFRDLLPLDAEPCAPCRRERSCQRPADCPSYGPGFVEAFCTRWGYELPRDCQSINTADERIIRGAETGYATALGGVRVMFPIASLPERVRSQQPARNPEGGILLPPDERMEA